MGILDVERVREALGPRLAERFLQYAGEIDANERKQLMMRIDEHVADLRHRQAAPDPRLADQVANCCKRLLLRSADVGPEACAAIVGAVRYFIDTHDLERDDEAHGFDDDEQVLNFVLEAVAPDLPRLA